MKFEACVEGWSSPFFKMTAYIIQSSQPVDKYG